MAARAVPAVCRQLQAGWPAHGVNHRPASAWQQHLARRRRSSSSAATAAAEAPASGSLPAAERGQPDDEQPSAAYVHLPFCKRKCSYCDFPVIAVGKDLAGTPHVQDNMRRYVDWVLQEVEASARLNVAPLTSVFFGGGTPSLLPLPLLEEILAALDRRFGLAAGAEVSIEADPGTFDAQRLRSYMGLGVNRFSVGVQTFQDDLLALCGRGHDLADVFRAVEAVHAAGVPNWSLDLMSGLPQLTEELWGKSLEQALDAGPHHISTYDLQVEEHTPFARRYSPGEAPLPSDASAAAMYHMASHVLRGAGLEHYEVSNFAMPGHRCAHNMAYWEGRSYYAFGLGSASYLEGRRFSRPKRLNAYRRWVEQYAADAAQQGRQVGGSWLPRESADDRLLDTVMLRLRLADGLQLGQLAASHPQGGEAVDALLRALRPHIARGWVLADGDGGAAAGGSSRGSGSAAVGGAAAGVVGRATAGSSSATPAASGAAAAAAAAAVAVPAAAGDIKRVRLADPEGFLVSNDIISDCFAAFDLTLSSEDGEE